MAKINFEIDLGNQFVMVSAPNINEVCKIIKGAGLFYVRSNKGLVCSEGFATLQEAINEAKIYFILVYTTEQLTGGI